MPIPVESSERFARENGGSGTASRGSQATARAGPAGRPGLDARKLDARKKVEVTKKVSSVVATVALVFVVFAGASASAQMTGTPTPGYRTIPGQPSTAIPAVLREIGYDQKLDGQLPLDTPFRDESGKTVPLGTYFGSKPVIVNFVYYECPMLCTQVLNGLASTLSVLSFEPGKDFEIVTISIDPRETPKLAAEKKAGYLTRYRRPTAAAGWHFLTGDEASIKRVTKAAGFRYVWDDTLKQFAHPTGVIVATPQGRISRYLFGIEYGPRDMRLALIESSQQKIGTPVDNVLLYCFHYDPVTGKYGFVVMRAVRIAGAATVLALGAFIIVMVRREKRQPAQAAPATTHPASLGSEVARAATRSRQSPRPESSERVKADPTQGTL